MPMGHKERSAGQVVEQQREGCPAKQFEMEVIEGWTWRHRPLEKLYFPIKSSTMLSEK
jgi:hypothetical protein